eukprot:8705099-Prorocentrum_lima.AAC.1
MVHSGRLSQTLLTRRVLKKVSSLTTVTMDPLRVKDLTIWMIPEGPPLLGGEKNGLASRSGEAPNYSVTLL